MINPSKWLLALTTSLYVTGFSQAVLGDDIDVFFGGPQQADTGAPNVLFILDDSGSMSWDIDDSRDSEKRITVLRRAFKELMNSAGANNINVGLMQLWGNGNGGERRVFPLTYIDKDLNTPSIISPELAEDGRELGIAVELDANALVLMPAAESTDTPLVALRFTDFRVPRGAVIESAELVLNPITPTSTTGNLSFTIQAENSGHSAPLQERDTDISARLRHQAVATFTSSKDSWKEGEPARFSQNGSTTALPQLLTQVVGHTDWCGGNALTLLLKGTGGDDYRMFQSLEGSGLPQLNVTYSGGAGGCIQSEISLRTESNNDVYQEDGDNDRNADRDTLRVRAYSSRRNRAERIGLRFTEVPVTQGSQIQKAVLNLQLADTSIAANLSIRVERADSAPPFRNRDDDVKNRYENGYGTVTWSIPANLDRGTRIQSPDLSTLLQSVINRGGWEADNALVLTLSSDDKDVLEFYARDESAGRAPQLVINTRGTASATGSYRVREHLSSLVDSMIPSSGTPVVPTLWEATRYLRGDYSGDWASPIKYACQSNHIVLLTDGEANSPTDSSRTGINGLDGMGEINRLLGNRSCSADASIEGEQCGRSLSAWLSLNDLRASVPDTNNVTLHTIGFAMDANANAKTFMQEMAALNQGCTREEMLAWEQNPDRKVNKSCGFYLSNNASSLVSAFADIFGSLHSIDSTFVTPGATVNQFNRSQHKNEIYFSLFKPAATQSWAGNLKRYELGGESSDGIKIVDLFGNAAVDPLTGFFREKNPTAHSFWSKKPDGNLTDEGGVADRLPATPGERTLYTDIDGQLVSIDSLSNAQLERIGNRPAELDGTLNGDTRAKLINWVKGYGMNGNAKPRIGDPLHSRPAVLTYGCDRWLDEASKNACLSATGDDLTLREYTNSALFFGTNEGFVHAVNTRAQSGAEHFAFIPYELLTRGHLGTWRSNAEITETRAYGMDGSPTIWRADANRNGVLYGGAKTAFDLANQTTPQENSLNAGEFAYAYFGMRRGGRNYYALNISNITQPRLLWQIEGGTGEFERLGQTWARPIKTRVKIGDQERDVLFISGGYDAGQDQSDATGSDYATYQGAYKPNDSMGNALYMVDAHTGALIWSASSSGDSGRTHNLILSRMNYSIPGNIRALDLYGDGLADQIFFADVGGQVWRLYINNGASLDHLVWPADSNGNGIAESSDGVMASLGDADAVITADDDATTRVRKRTHARRFYHEPDVAIYRANGTRYLAVMLGSGFHSDPMAKRNDDLQDRFYMLATPKLYNPDLGNEAVRQAGTIPVQTVLTHGEGSRLKDMTQDFSSMPVTDPSQAGGWYIRLAANERVTAPSIAQEHVIYFNSFQRHLNSTDPCDTSGGLGRAYRVSMFNGAPVNNAETPTHANRYEDLKSAGVPPETIILKPSDSQEVICVGAECESRRRGDAYARSYWREFDELIDIPVATENETETESTATEAQ